MPLVRTWYMLMALCIQIEKDCQLTSYQRMSITWQRESTKLHRKMNSQYALWQDTKPVLVLSNGHGPQGQHNVSWKGADGHCQQIPAPKMVADYQNNMKGIDMCDQMVGYYMPPHRSNKWWHSLFFFFLSVSIHNAYILAKKSHPASGKEKWSDLKLFIQDLVLELIGNVWTTRQVTLVTNENRHTALHTLSKNVHQMACLSRMPPMKCRPWCWYNLLWLWEMQTTSTSDWGMLCPACPSQCCRQPINGSPNGHIRHCTYVYICNLDVYFGYIHFICAWG